MYLPPTIYSVLVSIIIFIVSYYRTNTTLARAVLFCAEKRGRFIPCRGGGTSTTYYTDWHDVDENERTASVQGGHWIHESKVGVTRQNLDRWNAPTSSDSLDTVASRLIYLS